MPDRHAADLPVAEPARVEPPVAEPVADVPAQGDEVVEAVPPPSARDEVAPPEALVAPTAPVQGWFDQVQIPTAVLIALVAVVLALAALGGYFWTSSPGGGISGGGTSDATRQAVLQVARQDAVNFATYDYRHLEQDFAYVANASTGSFHDQFLQSAKALTPTFQQLKATATGTAQDAGIVRLTHNHAVVLVYVDQTVQNTQRPQPSIGRFRFEIDLVRQGNQWLITNLAPV